MALTLATERRPADPTGAFTDVSVGHATVDLPGAPSGTADLADDLPLSEAVCATGNGELAQLFFSEEVGDIARAKELCSACPVMLECLEGAAARREPAGVWGGQLFSGGRIVTGKRRPGRPAAVTRPGDQVPDLPVPVHLRRYLRSA
jgi:WhiB family redox-sensing transcriptional regulator